MFYWRDSLLKKIKMGLINAEGGDGDKGGGDGGDTGVPDWAKTMPETVQGWDEVKNSDSSEKFWDQMSNQRSRLGRSITIPGEDAGKEDWDTFHGKLTKQVPGLMPKPDLEDDDARSALYGSLGRPDKPDGYAIPEVKVEGYDDAIDMTQAEEFRNIAHKVGLNGSQFDQIVTAVTTANVQAGHKAAEENIAAHKELKKEWGEDYNRRMSLATNIAKLTDAPEGLYNALKEGRGAPQDYKWLFEIASSFKGEGKNLSDDKNDKNVSMTPDEASTKINEIKNNKQHPYWDKSLPGHNDAVKRMTDLYKLKSAGG